ncbi:hypothetical protein Nepgr_013504 [Nepenthes gracilis]|uniref:Uncharacterized protein n=1 Tax=Nepenthes gracilis TaxID=150966 RepID=A0AAD3SI37_NEPGR|nr:hypothetical protein Nepgr_013504 [Nepenthes gracilis]
MFGYWVDRIECFRGPGAYCMAILFAAALVPGSVVFVALILKWWLLCLLTEWGCTGDLVLLWLVYRTVDWGCYSVADVVDDLASRAVQIGSIYVACWLADCMVIISGLILQRLASDLCAMASDLCCLYINTGDAGWSYAGPAMKNSGAALGLPDYGLGVLRQLVGQLRFVYVFSGLAPNFSRSSVRWWLTAEFLLLLILKMMKHGVFAPLAILLLVELMLYVLDLEPAVGPGLVMLCMLFGLLVGVHFVYSDAAGGCEACWLIPLPGVEDAPLLDLLSDDFGHVCKALMIAGIKVLKQKCSLL